MGYSIMFLWVLLPATTLTVSLLIGKNGDGGKVRWLLALFFGIMYMLAEYATFDTANMIAFEKVNLPEFSMVLIGTLISVAGMGIGSAIGYLSSRIKKSTQ